MCIYVKTRWHTLEETVEAGVDARVRSYSYYEDLPS